MGIMKSALARHVFIAQSHVLTRLSLAIFLSTVWREARISVASNFARCASPAFCSKIELPTRPSVVRLLITILFRASRQVISFFYKNFLSQPLAWFYSYNLSHAIGAEMRKLPAHARTHRHSAAVGRHLFYCHPLGVNQNKVHWHTDARAWVCVTLCRTAACSARLRGEHVELMHFGFLWVRSSVEEANINFWCHT
jgi:hypothetical protein